MQAEIRRLMEEEELYTQDDLTLPAMAELLQVTPHQLSQYLNERLQKSFPAFINDHRIEAACLLLTDNPDRTVLSICYAVGFNSKSSFNSAFQKKTGQSPVQYRKSRKGK